MRHDKKLQRKRHSAHLAFDRLWQKGGMGRDEAYEWLAGALGISKAKCHMSLMDKKTACRVIFLACGKWSELKAAKKAKADAI